MRVLFATAELAPLVKVGGLGDAVSGLVKALGDRGLEVDVVIPDYWGDRYRNGASQSLEVPEWAGPAVANLAPVPGTRTGLPPLYAVDGAPDPYNDVNGKG